MFDELLNFLDNENTVIKEDDKPKIESLSSDSISETSDQLKERTLNIFYKKLENLGFNLSELKDIFECKTDLLLIAGAGAGKTTTITLKLIKDLLAGDFLKTIRIDSIDGPLEMQIQGKILVATFLKTGADDLQKSFVDWCTKLKLNGIDFTAITFKTLHAEIYNAVESFGVKINILPEYDTNSDGDGSYVKGSQGLLKDAMSYLGIKSNSSNSNYLTIEEVNDMACVVAYARNRLDNKRYEHAILDDYNVDSIMLDALLIEYKKRKVAAHGVDFEDIQEMLLEGLKVNPVVRDFIGSRYDFIFIDEFQDTSQLQYEVLKYYFNGAKRVTVVGDDDQTIYGWRGSDIDIINFKYEEDYKPTVLQLPVNYRCKSNILNFTIPSIMCNAKRHAKELRSYNIGGSVKIVENDNINFLLDTVKEGLPLGSVGVLARTNNDLLMPTILLELAGQYNFSVSKSVSLNKRLPAQIISLMDLVQKRYSNNFESSLKLFVSKYYSFEVTKLITVLQNNKKASLFNINMNDIRSSVPHLAPIIEGLRLASANDKVQGYIYLLDYLCSNVYTGDSKYVQNAKAFVIFMKRLIIEHETLSAMSIAELEILFNDTLPAKFKERAKYSKNACIKLTTVHEAKGKEWDSVIIWNDTKGSFPNSIGKRNLTADEYEEERRIHYIACTRAKEKLTIFTMKDNYGDFLKECLAGELNVDTEVEKSMSEVLVATGVKRGGIDFSSKLQAKKASFSELYKNYVNFVYSTMSPSDTEYCDLDLVLSNYSLESLEEELVSFNLDKCSEDVMSDALRNKIKEISDGLM